MIRTWPPLLTVLLALALLLGALPPLEGAELEAQTPFIDWSDEAEYPPASPDTPSALGIDVFAWAGNRFLVVNSGFGLYLHSIANPLHPKEETWARFACPQATVICPLQQPADYDHVLYRLAVCDDCSLGIAACGIAGTLIFGWKDYGNGVPRVSITQAGVISTQQKGVATFSYDGTQMIASSDWPGGCSTATLWRVVSSDPIALAVQQCLPSTTVNDGVRIGDYFYLITSASKVDVYQITGSGETLFLTFIDSPMLTPVSVFGRSLRADLEAQRLLIAKSEPGLWSVAAPAEPGLLSELSGVWYRAALDGPIAWTSDGRVSMTWNISDPLQPQQLAPEFWDSSDPDNTHLQYLRQSPRDAVIVNVGGQEYLYAVDYTVAWVAAIADLPDPIAIYSDGFETGNASTWSVVWPTEEP